MCVPVHSKRAFIVTDPPLFEMGMVNGVLERLRALGIAAKVFTDVEPDPTLGMVTKVRLTTFCVAESCVEACGLAWAMPSRCRVAVDTDSTLGMVIKVRLLIRLHVVLC
jgi:hypothetical protein